MFFFHCTNSSCNAATFSCTDFEFSLISFTRPAKNSSLVSVSSSTPLPMGSSRICAKSSSRVCIIDSEYFESFSLPSVTWLRTFSNCSFIESTNVFKSLRMTTLASFAVFKRSLWRSIVDFKSFAND